MPFDCHWESRRLPSTPTREPLERCCAQASAWRLKARHVDVERRHLAAAVDRDPQVADLGAVALGELGVLGESTDQVDAVHVLLLPCPVGLGLCLRSDSAPGRRAAHRRSEGKGAKRPCAVSRRGKIERSCKGLPAGWKARSRGSAWPCRRRPWRQALGPRFALRRPKRRVSVSVAHPVVVLASSSESPMTTWRADEAFRGLLGSPLGSSSAGRHDSRAGRREASTPCAWKSCPRQASPRSIVAVVGVSLDWTIAMWVSAGHSPLVMPGARVTACLECRQAWRTRRARPRWRGRRAPSPRARGRRRRPARRRRRSRVRVTAFRPVPAQTSHRLAWHHAEASDELQYLQVASLVRSVLPPGISPPPPSLLSLLPPLARPPQPLAPPAPARWTQPTTCAHIVCVRGRRRESGANRIAHAERW